MAWMDGLTGIPFAIARTTDNPLRVMAGPGTGKSYAMKRRLMRLLEEGVAPSTILVATFTRIAAATLLEEIQQLGVPGCEKIRTGTLHSYCFRLLGEGAVLHYTKRKPRPLVTFSDKGILQFEAAPLLEDLGRLGDFGDKRKRTQRIRAYEADWARFQSDNPGSPTDQVDISFRDELLKWLRFHEAMFIGEVVPVALKYLQDNPAGAANAPFRHILVDEFQDLNKAEQVLIDLLAQHGNYAIFGDEDQSIYSFRWAHPEGIVQFHETHPNTADYRLDECHRCPVRVVAMANHLIRHNHRPGSEARLNPKASNPQGDVHLVQWQTLEEEAQGLAEFANFLITEKKYRPGDILVLCPRRLLGYTIREALESRNIPTHSFYQEEALEGDMAKRAFSLLTLLAKRTDRVALRYWLGAGSEKWNSRAYAELRLHCERSGMSPWKALEALSSDQLSLSYSAPLIEKFTELRDELSRFEQLPPRTLINLLLPEGYPWATELRELALEGGIEGLDASKLLDRLRTQITQPEVPEAGQHVRVMSLHKSKGLTSKAVIIAGCIQGLIPNIRNEGTPQELEELDREQRRLFSVALTRCKEVLLLSSVARLERRLGHLINLSLPAANGEFCSTIASSFLSELGPMKPPSQRGDVFLRVLAL